MIVGCLSEGQLVLLNAQLTKCYFVFVFVLNISDLR